jgi:hypothetical protein
MLKAIPFLFQLAALIGSSVSSFLIAPPIFYPAEEELPVNWISIFSFTASLISVFISRNRKVQTILRQKIAVRIWLIVLLLVAAGIYEQLYRNYSVACFQEARVVISKDSVKVVNFDYWLRRWGDLAVHKFLEANRCNSTEVWPISKLLPQYYGMQCTYFLVIISFTFLSCSLPTDIGIDKSSENAKRSDM